MDTKLKKVSITWKEEVTVITDNNKIKKDKLSDKSSKLKYLDLKENCIAKNYHADLLFEKLIITD